MLVAFFISFLSDADFSFANARSVIPGYGVLILHGIASSGIDHTRGILAPALGGKVYMMASTIGATIVALPFYIFKSLMVSTLHIFA